MFDLPSYVEKITQLKKQNPKCLTNNFLNYEELKALSQKEETGFLYNQNAAVIFDNDNGVNRVYFNLLSLQTAGSLKELLDLGNFAKPYIIDCLGKEVFLEELKSTFENNGIKLYTKMNRWRAAKIHNLLKLKQTDGMMPAKVENVKEINNLLNEVFDPYVSHLPSEENLKNLIENNLVFCIKEENKIIAVFCFELLGKESIYFYQDAVDKDYQGTGIGVLLLHYSLQHYKGMKNFTGWIEYTNQVSEKMHSFLGMKKDGLMDYVFIYK